MRLIVAHKDIRPEIVMADDCFEEFKSSCATLFGLNREKVGLYLDMKGSPEVRKLSDLRDGDRLIITSHIGTKRSSPGDNDERFTSVKKRVKLELDATTRERDLMIERFKRENILKEGGDVGPLEAFIRSGGPMLRPVYLDSRDYEWFFDGIITDDDSSDGE